MATTECRVEIHDLDDLDRHLSDVRGIYGEEARNNLVHIYSLDQKVAQGNSFVQGRFPLQPPWIGPWVVTKNSRVLCFVEMYCKKKHTALLPCTYKVAPLLGLAHATSYGASGTHRADPILLCMTYSREIMLTAPTRHSGYHSNPCDMILIQYHTRTKQYSATFAMPITRCRCL